ncbi:MAG: hypothetical protein WA820_06315 [Bradyrhizobium sp.]
MHHAPYSSCGDRRDQTGKQKFSKNEAAPTSGSSSTFPSMVQLPRVCKTDECGSLATEGAALIADAQTKHQKGLLVDAERATFHDNLDSVLTRTIAAIRANRKTTTTAKVKLPDGFTCPAQPKTKSVVFDQDRCDLCYEMFEQLAEICALYTIVSPDAALICLASATLQFGHCLKEFCGGA